MMKTIPCPFVYANGRKCPGHITRVEAYGVEIEWCPDSQGNWQLSISQPRSHYHLFCSEKGNHAGVRGSDSEQMNFYGNKLPEDLKLALRESVRRSGNG